MKKTILAASTTPSRPFESANLLTSSRIRVADLLQLFVLLAVQIVLIILLQALPFALFALSLGGQLLLALGAQFAALQLSLNILKILLKLEELVLPGFELGLFVGAPLLELSGSEYRLLRIDHAQFHLRGGNAREKPPQGIQNLQNATSGENSKNLVFAQDQIVRRLRS